MLEHFNQILIRTPLQSIRNSYNFKLDISTLFDEGIYLSSPDFWREYHKNELSNKKIKEKIESSFSKYWLRSCTRCTPYGTFAGSMLTCVDNNPTTIVLNENTYHIRKVRLDMNFVTELINALMQLSTIKNQARLNSNNTLYTTPEEWRYAEHNIKNNIRDYNLTSIAKTPYIKHILDMTKEQSPTIKDLKTFLIKSENVTHADADAFITNLLDAQILVSQLEPCITGSEPLDQLISRLESFHDIDMLKKHLKSLQVLILNPLHGVAYYLHIEEKLKALVYCIEEEININPFSAQQSAFIRKRPKIKIPKNTIQVDLFLDTKERHFNKTVLESCLKQANDLFFLARKHENRELSQFVNKFHAKYEEKEISLPIALDSDLGIGYAGISDESSGGSEYVNQLAVTSNLANSGQPFNYLQKYALGKYEDYIRNNKTEIELTEQELKEFEVHTKSLKFPKSLALMGSMLKLNGKLDSENFLFDISSMSGPSAGNLLGRFTHGDEQLQVFVKKLLAKEEEEVPDAIYAEIVHLPQARVGNILLRPILRKYEIPYSGSSGIDIENQILIEDLAVSIRDNKIFLRSKKHNRQVIPRLTTAHNFTTNSLPVYKFLCDLQMQDLSWPNSWDWGHLINLKRLPRVVYKNLIIRKAIWKIEEKDIEDLPSEKLMHIQFFKKFQESKGLPTRVVYKEGDNILLIDFNEEKGVELLVHYLKRHKNILLEEFLFTEENCIVQDLNGQPYTNEVVIPISYHTKMVTNGNINTKDTDIRQLEEQFHKPILNIQDKFPLISEWLYFKIYCGAKIAEKVLCKYILPFVKKKIKNNLFQKFFFIRYRDEIGGHIRIRFYNENIETQTSLQIAFIQCLQPLIDNGAINNITMDSYSRELERYNPRLIEEAESLFFNDSFAILKFLDILSQVQDSDKYRMLFGMRGIDMLLDDFEFTLSEKLRLLQKMRTSFFKEFGEHPVLKKQLNDRYRKYQKEIRVHMDPENDEENEIEEAVGIFINRSKLNKPILTRIHKKLTETDKELIIFNLMPNYMHMFMNRLFVAQQRKYELVIYSFLERFYTSKVEISQKRYNLKEIR